MLGMGKAAKPALKRREWLLGVVAPRHPP
jgi:hypothetical protein